MTTGTVVPDNPLDHANRGVFERQLRYERALAGCSQILLKQVEDDHVREQVLSEALAALLKAACVSRIGLFAMGHHDNLGPTFQMIAEATAPGFPSRLDESREPVSAASWSALHERLRAGEVIRTRFRELYAHNPDALASLDVKSVFFCPVQLDDVLWGYLAYGDASEDKDWDNDEIRLIRTASQMFAGALGRWQAEGTLRQQYRIQLALSRCSQSLLSTRQSHDSHMDALNEALAHLMEGADVQRAYLFRNYSAPEQGDCMGIVAEAVAPGVTRHIANPFNHKVPWSLVPSEQRQTLLSNRPFAGPVERLFVSTPILLEEFRRQGLRAVLMVPVHMGDVWWGFIGFDDLKTAREWDDSQTSLLQTAAEMVSHVIRRWELELELEQRVLARTVELAETNARLSQEIVERRQAEEAVQRHLAQERILATISARLLQESDYKVAIVDALGQLAEIMRAERTILFWFNPPGNHDVRIIDWHTDRRANLQPDFYRVLAPSLGWARAELDAGRTVICRAPADLPPEAGAERRYLEENGIGSLLIVPVQAEDRLLGALACTDFATHRDEGGDGARVPQVVAGMLGSQLRRQELLSSLEERIAARTAEVMAFLEITVLAGEALPLADILQPALQKVVDISACDAAAIHLLAPDGETLRLAAYAGPRHSELPADFQTLKCGSWCTIANNPFVVPDLSATANPLDVPRMSGYNVYAGAVLQAQDKVNGLLSCYWQQLSRPITIDLLTILVALAEQLGIVVENHRLRQQADEVSATRERQRLAQELHDAVAQTLYGLNLFARAGKDALQNNDSAKLQRSLDYLEENALQALKEMRLLLYQMQSSAPGKTIDLADALERRFNEVERRLGIQASLEIEPEVALPTCEQRQRELYLILTEALNNSLKHANASTVQVQVRTVADGVRVCVRDNGRGFDITQQQTGMGLQSIQARADRLHGRVSINSRPQAGTEVCLWLAGNENSTGNGPSLRHGSGE